jgi:S-DNA-T family DNA segregation ATPase FtsK/SpoIIIE
VGVAFLLLTLPIRALALAGTRRRLAPLAADVLEARRLGHLAIAMAEQNKREIERAIHERRDAEVSAGRAKYENRLARVRLRREQILARLDRKHRVMADEIRRKRKAAFAEAEGAAADAEAGIEAERAEGLGAADRARAEAVRAAESAHEAEMSDLAMRWRETLERARACLADAEASTARSCPAWTSEQWAGWTPPLEVPGAVRLGSFRADLDELEGGRPEDEALMEGLPASFEPGALLDVPEHASLLVRTGPEGRDASLAAVRNAVLRVLTALPAGKARLTMIDPVGLGQSFAGFMRLADHDERLVGSRIWTEARHIEQRLADLTEHMETVIQKYLRNEFESIEAYNEKAGEIAEPYRFLVVADFPTGFTEESARRLAASSSRAPAAASSC